MINRSCTWLNDDIEHSEQDAARARALAERWSRLETVREERCFRAQARAEDGHDYGPHPCEDCPACAAGDFDRCAGILAAEARERERVEAERVELEVVEEMLARVGARMMRPYEHWHEDEQFMEYSERER